MKTYQSILLILLMAFAPQANAQFLKKLGKKVENAAERAIERRAERETEKSTDRVLDSIVDAPKEKKISIAEIDYSVGFNDPSYFTKCFKTQFGVSPSDYII